MRRIFIGALLLIAWVCFAPRSEAQFNGCKAGFCQTQAVSGFTPSCSQSSTFLAAATGITLTADKTNYDALICGMVTDGTFAEMDALYIFAAPTQATALINLVNPGTFNATTVGTVSFSAYHGFTGDGSTFVLDSGFNPSTASSPKYTQNSASYGFYDLSTNTTENAVAIGSDNTFLGQIGLQPNFGQLNATINGGTGNTNIGIANSQGFFIGTRTSSSNVTAAKNNGAPSNAASTSTGVDNVTTTIFARHDGSGATYVGFTPDQGSAAFIGGALSNTDISNVSCRVNKFMAAYSINVYTQAGC